MEIPEFDLNNLLHFHSQDGSTRLTADSNNKYEFIPGALLKNRDVRLSGQIQYTLIYHGIRIISSMHK